MSKDQKTIGIDARFFGEAGPGRYAKAIVEHLEEIDHGNKYKVFLRKTGFENYHPKNPNFQKIMANYKWYSWEEQTGFLLTLLCENLDLLYVPHFNIPVLYPGKLITAIPDIIMHTFSTEDGTTLPKFYFKMKKFVYKLVVFWAVLRSKKVIVPSHSVINDFREIYPYISENKYSLVYEGVDPVFLDSDLNEQGVLKKHEIKKPFLLYISSMYEHKNVRFLIEAFKTFIKKTNSNYQLVLFGKRDKFSEN